VGLFLLADDGVLGAALLTHQAAGAGLGVDRVDDELLAQRRRALLVLDVRDVLFPEQLQRGQADPRGWRAATERPLGGFL
jgi:hypothetical protein